MTERTIAQPTLKMSVSAALRTLIESVRGHLLDEAARRSLSRLPDHLLSDVGLTREKGFVPGNQNSHDIASRLEIEDRRRRLF